MYIIINSTTKHTDCINGDFPAKAVESMLTKGEKFIIISLYSNTVKVPRSWSVNWDSTVEWEWDEFQLPSDLFMRDDQLEDEEAERSHNEDHEMWEAEQRLLEWEIEQGLYWEGNKEEEQ